MSWGYQQGCAFVKSRCGTYAAGASVTALQDPAVATVCDGDPRWAAYNDPYLAEKCEYGVDPCNSARFNGGTSCDVQCYTGTAVPRDDCIFVPPGAVGSAGSGQRGVLAEYWMQWLWLGVWILGALVVVGCIRSCLCPMPGSVPILATLSVLLLLVGFALAAASVYIGYFDGFFGTAIFEGLFGKPTVIGAIATGCFVVALSLLGLVAMCAHSPKAMMTSYVLQILLLVLEILAAIFISYYVWSLSDVASSSMANVNGEGEGRYDGRLGETALAEIEGLACRTYQLCCRDPRLDLVATANATCIPQPEGQLDVSTILMDASNPLFCEYISGSVSILVPPTAVCDAIDWTLPGLDRDTCQQNFCTHGTDGYLDFIEAVIAWLRSNAMPLGGSAAMIVLIQLIAIVNAWNLRKRYLREEEAHRRSTQRTKQREGAQAYVQGRPTDGVVMGTSVTPTRTGRILRGSGSSRTSGGTSVARC